MADSKRVSVFSSDGVLTARAPGDTPIALQQSGEPLSSGVLTVATLPEAAVGLTSTRAFVSDASTTMALGVGTEVAGGGANAVPVYCDGAAWLIG